MANNRNKRGKDTVITSSGSASPSSSPPSSSPTSSTALQQNPVPSAWGKALNLSAANTTQATAATAPAAAPATPASTTTAPIVIVENGTQKGNITNAAPRPVVPSSISSSSASHLSSSLQFGSHVRVTTALREVIEGVVYLYDPAAQVCALEIKKGDTKDYTMINTNNITVSVLSAPPSTVVPSYPAIDHAKLSMKESRALVDRQSEAAKIGGAGVTIEGQRIFDSLAKLWPTQWSGTSIIVMDVMKLSPPYSIDSLTGGSTKQQERIRKVLQQQGEKHNNR